MVVVFPEKQFTRSNGTVRNGYYMNEHLKYALDNHLIPPIYRDDMDCILLMDGKEGSGKTTFAASILYYIDPTFPGENCERVVFSAEELMRVADKCVRGQAIMFDEAILGAGSQDHASLEQQKLIKYFMTARKRGLVYIMICPYVFSLRKYFIMRARGLIHAYIQPNKVPGRRPLRAFKVYGHPIDRPSTLLKLYIDGHKYMDYNVAQGDFKGVFSDTFGFFFNVNTYQSKKDIAIRSIQEGDGDKKKEQFVTFYKQRVSLLLEKYKAYRLSLKDKFDKLQTEEKKKLLDFKLEMKEKVKELKEVGKMVGKGKVPEIPDARDKLFYSVYKEKFGEDGAINCTEFMQYLKTIGITEIHFEAVKHYLVNGKRLYEIEKLTTET